MPFTTIGEIKFYTEEIGEGIPIVMIHGLSPDHRLMKGCMEPIFNEKTGYRRIYFDLPGMGRTENYHNILSSDDVLEAVIHLIEHHIPNEPFLIAGESFGGYLARGVGMATVFLTNFIRCRTSFRMLFRLSLTMSLLGCDDLRQELTVKVRLPR